SRQLDDAERQSRAWRREKPRERVVAAAVVDEDQFEADAALEAMRDFLGRLLHFRQKGADGLGLVEDGDDDADETWGCHGRAHCDAAGSRPTTISWKRPPRLMLWAANSPTISIGRSPAIAAACSINS